MEEIEIGVKQCKLIKAIVENAKKIVHKECDFLYLELKWTKLEDTLDRTWNTLEKELKEISVYDYVFLELVQVLTVPQDRVKPTISSGGRSH